MRASRYHTNAPNDPRRLHLKIRVVLTQFMTATEARTLLDRAARTGIVPPGIDIYWIDWAKGLQGDTNTDGSPVQHGEGRVLSDQMRAALRHFYGAITKSDTRFERVK